MRKTLLTGSLALISLVASASPSPGGLAKPPYPSAPPQIFVVRDSEIKPSSGDTVIEDSIKKYATDYGVQIDQRAVAGYILDLDQADPDQPTDGFDLDAHLADPAFAPWFHNPVPYLPDSVEYARKLWLYASTGAHEGFEPDKLRVALAYTHIDHVFFPRSKFDRGYYVNLFSGVATDEGFESVLHEALHIWHLRFRAEVTALLKTPGSYFDRLKAAERTCPSFREISSMPEAKERCGFKTEAEAIMAVLKESKWPQRYGEITLRAKARVKDRYGCGRGRESMIDGKLVCFQEDEGSRAGDLHALDSEMEYFAILMQLSVLSPLDFERVATPAEAQFAKHLFSTVFSQR